MRDAAVLEIAGVVKAYGGLRPLRVEQLALQPGQQVALLGIDQIGAEVLINLITGATLPDRGDVCIGGRSTALIADSEEWMALSDTVGVVTERAVLLESFSAIQNLAVPFSLDIDPLPPALREQAVALARDVGLDEGDWDRPLSAAAPSSRLRVRIGRALALAPRLMVMEHPSASLSRHEVTRVGGELRGLLESRGTASLTLTADAELAAAIADEVLQFEPASGTLTPARPSGWFGRWRRSH